MQVGIVGYELEGETTGVGRYLAGLLSGLRNVAPRDWRFLLFFHRSVPELELLQHSRFAAALPSSPAPESVVWYEQTVLPALVRSARVDVLFSPGYSLPPRTGRPAW